MKQRGRRLKKARPRYGVPARQTQKDVQAPAGSLLLRQALPRVRKAAPILAACPRASQVHSSTGPAPQLPQAVRRPRIDARQLEKHNESWLCIGKQRLQLQGEREGKARVTAQKQGGFNGEER